MNSVFLITFFYILGIISTLGYGFLFKRFFIKDAKLDLPIDYNVKDFKEVENTITGLIGEKYSLNKINKVIIITKA